MIEMNSSFEPEYKNIGNNKKIIYKEIKRLKLLFLISILFSIIIFTIFYLNLKTKINNSIKIIEKLEKENINLNNQINQLKGQFKKDKTKIEENNNKIENKFKDISGILNIYSPYLNKLKQSSEIYKYKSFNETSSIINNEISKQNSIINWIKTKINKDKIEFELIFKMSINGNSAYDFHKYCDNVGPTLILIKTTKDKIFGGFTPLNWEEETEKGVKFDYSDETFIFSLNLMKKYDMIDKNKEAIKCWNKMGPVFSNDFGLFENLKKGESYANTYSNFLSNKKLELTGGKGNSKKFETKELEVYRVIY